VRKEVLFLLVLATGLAGGRTAVAEHPETPSNENSLINNYLDNWTMTWGLAGDQGGSNFRKLFQQKCHPGRFSEERYSNCHFPNMKSP